MKIGLTYDCKEDYSHLTNEQKAEFDSKKTI